MKYAQAFLLILFTLTFVLAMEVHAQEIRAMQVVPKNNRYALLIGVNEYPNEKKLLKTLPSAVKDMKDLANALEEYADFPRENITLMTDDSPADMLPTRENIRTQVTKLLPKLTQDDLLIVAFSGHGVTIDYQDGTEPRPYFCVRDTDLPDTKTLVRRDWLFDKIDECPAVMDHFCLMRTLASNSLALISCVMERPDAAIDTYERHVLSTPFTALHNEARCNAGRMCELKNDPESAKKFYSEVQGPMKPQAQFGL